MNPTFFLSCLESRIEDNTSWYSKFEIGPFPNGQALTVANSLRRTLLSQRQGVFIIGVEIEGAIHEYSRLKGLQESILDVLLNLRQLALISTTIHSQPQETLIGYFDIQGPATVTARDLQFPKGVECVNVNQHIATLSRDGCFRGRFLISLQAQATPALGDPVKMEDESHSSSNQRNFSKVQWLALNPILNPVRRVNYSVEQFKNVWEKQEVAIIELWTNGSIHPRKALQEAISNLAQTFLSISWINGTTFRSLSVNEKFLDITQNLSSVSQLTFLKDLPISTSKTLKGSSTELLAATVNVADEVDSDRISTLLDLDIANLNLSLKTFLSLKELGIQNLGNLMEFVKLDSKDLTSLASTQKQEIKQSLAEFGFSLNL
jgi:DNA-directed RNA polymerase subunit alpha